MAGTPSPVTPAVLRWALDEDGRSDVDLADKLRVDEDTLLAWSKGDARPTTGQVTSLAKVLQRPRALFFLPAVPERAGLPTSFRHPPGAAREASANVRRWLRQARRVQEAVAWALRDAPPVPLPTYSIHDNAASAAERVRKWSGVTAEHQAGWRNGYQALRAWRSALDDKGVLVLSLAMGRREVRGFASFDERAPLIAVNSSSVSPQARCYTIGHELGHLVTRTDAACVDEALVSTRRGADVERWCEAFAAAWLMPADDVRAWAQQRRIRQRGATVEDVAVVGSKFHVTVYAAALRLRELGLAPPDLYDRVLLKYPPPPSDDERTGSSSDKVVSTPVHEERLRQYGGRVLQLVLASLPPPDALSVLRMDVPAVRQLSERLPGVDDGI